LSLIVLVLTSFGMTQVRMLSTELPVQDIDDIFSKYKELRKASGVAGIARDDVQKDFERVIMNEEKGEIKKMMMNKLQAAQAELQQLLSTDQLGKGAEVVQNLTESISLQGPTAHPPSTLLPQPPQPRGSLLCARSRLCDTSYDTLRFAGR
jgi:hypothetical protein